MYEQTLIYRSRRERSANEKEEENAPNDNRIYYMACSCSRHNALSDWLIVGHYSPVMPKGRPVRACKNKAKSRMINNF